MDARIIMQSADKELTRSEVNLLVREAMVKGLKTYYTGIECINGHLADRYVSSKSCVACRADLNYRDCLKLKNRGITRQQYDDMLKSQNNLCAICEKPLGTGQDVNIDHCHTTNIVRGVLCRYCNMGLGNFRDNIKALKNAAIYLERFT